MIYLFLALLIIPVYLYYKKTLPEISKRNRFLLAGLRWMSIALIVMILTNPILYLFSKYSYKPELLVLNDVSSSMTMAIDGKSKTKVISSFAREISDKFKASGYKITEDSFADGYKGKPNSTNLITALETMSKMGKLSHVSKILLVSDGWFRDDDLGFIQDLNIPIFTFNPDIKADSTDLQISYVNYDRITYRNEKTPILVGINAVQYKGKATARLLVNKKQIASQIMDFSREGIQQITFEPVFTQSGLQSFEISCEMQGKKERTTENNTYPGAVQVLNDKTRILLLTDKYTWDVKFIQDAIRTNARWKMDVYQVRDGQLWKGLQPISPNVLTSTPYESVIIINNGYLSLPSVTRQWMINNVNKGTGLFVMGKPISGLDEILPASLSNIAASYQAGFNLNTYASGYAFLDFDRKIISDIPPVQYYYVQAKPGSTILGTIDNDQKSPAILMKQVGSGKVLEFAFTDLWKWQMWSDDGKYQSMISNIMYWMGDQETDRFRAQTTKNSYFLGERIRVVLSAVDDKQMPLSDVDAHIQVWNEGRHIVFDDYLIREGDDFGVQLPTLGEGKYSFRIVDVKSKQQTEGSFIVSGENLEARDYGFNQPTLFYISQITNGKSLSKSDIQSFQPVKEHMKSEERKMEIPLYRKWYLIALFLLCFCLELLLRRLWGLL